MTYYAGTAYSYWSQRSRVASQSLASFRKPGIYGGRTRGTHEDMMADGVSN